MLPRVSDGFFGPPPRPRGRGWWRRFRRSLGWAALAVGVGGVCVALAAAAWIERAESLRLARRGAVRQARVVEKRSTSGKSPAYYVRLSLVGRRSPAFERQVTRREWMRVQRDMLVPYYCDERTGRGVASIERSHRERLEGLVVFSLIAFVSIAVGGGGAFRAMREMRLFRHGQETVTFGQGRYVPGPRPDEPVSIRAALAREAHVRVGRAGEELVVLVLDGGRRWLVPQLRDVPVERLVSEGPEARLLAAPFRDMTREWRRWANRRGRGWLVALAAIATLGGAAALFAHAVARVSFPWVVAVTAVAVVVLGLAWLRGRVRDAVLWREGEEVHAVLIEERWEQRHRAYGIAFRYRDVEYRASARVPDAYALLRASSPPDAPAVTNRVVILVDPVRPVRWAPVPAAVVEGA